MNVFSNLFSSLRILTAVLASSGAYADGLEVPQSLNFGTIVNLYQTRLDGNRILEGSGLATPQTISLNADVNTYAPCASFQVEFQVAVDSVNFDKSTALLSELSEPILSNPPASRTFGVPLELKSDHLYIWRSRSISHLHAAQIITNPHCMPDEYKVIYSEWSNARTAQPRDAAFYTFADWSEGSNMGIANAGEAGIICGSETSENYPPYLTYPPTEKFSLEFKTDKKKNCENKITVSWALYFQHEKYHIKDGTNLYICKNQ